MNLDPQKFFIGLMDFFSILLPGALLNYLFINEFGQALLGDRYSSIAGVEAAALFLFVSYLSGHMIFLLGTWLDLFYDLARRHTLNMQISNLAHRDRLLPWCRRALIWLVFQKDKNVAMTCVGRLKRQALDPIKGTGAINNFQWCKVLLNISSPSSLAVVQRFEADSKFFRCFSVVLLLLIFAWPLQNRWPLAGIFVVLGMLLLALWRFMEQRFKATNQAYGSVITLSGQALSAETDSAGVAIAYPSQIGGIVTRRRCECVEFLLVESSTDSDLWELPRGSAEENEHPAETAVRKVHEAAGIWAGICRDEDNRLCQLPGRHSGERYYVMQLKGRGLRSDKCRRHEWLTLHDAALRVKSTGASELLNSAAGLEAEIFEKQNAVTWSLDVKWSSSCNTLMSSWSVQARLVVSQRQRWRNVVCRLLSSIRKLKTYWGGHA